MYECPNCAGNMKFHIGKQQLFCAHCESTMSPYAFQKESDAEEQEVFEATIFTCPQCGGELLTEDTTAATFCSYCGSSTILFSRISKEKSPQYIIPFSKTKEDCVDSYRHMVNRAFFAPKELREVEHIEKFRGIYMPYWLYSFRKNGISSFKGAKEESDKKYNTINYYRISSQVDAFYNDIPFDASTTFSDCLAQTITPFDMEKKMPFSPAFLSGFYADRYDVASDFYQKEAELVVMNDITSTLKKDKALSDFQVKKQMKEASLTDTLNPEEKEAHLSFLPVWFLAYQKKNRVAYAIVNGQTGEACADLPIDPKRFVISSILLALPIILFLNSFLTCTPSTLLSWCSFIAGIFAIVANYLTTYILFKESYIDIHLLSATEKENKRQKDKLALLGSCILLFIIEIPALAIYLIPVIIKYFSIALTIMAAAFIIYLYLDLSHLRKTDGLENINIEIYQATWKTKRNIMLKPMITIVVALVVICINPISDIVFYGTALFCLVMLLWSVSDMIRCHNLITTRRLPQLNKRGGEEHA